MRRDNVSIIMLSVCMAAVVLSAVLIGYSFGAANAAALAAPDAPQTVAAVSAPAVVQDAPTVAQCVPAGSIALPGFERLTAEGRTLHAGAVSNPALNSCYFVVSIVLSDGSEVYRSGFIAPGQSLGDVQLSRDVAAGVYEGATARYSCYTLTQKTPLNGADITFTLEVQS